MSCNGDVQIINKDELHDFKSRQLSLANAFFTFKDGRKIGEGIEYKHLGESGRSVCNVVGCGFTVEGKDARILISHLQKHKVEYAEFMSKCKEVQKLETMLPNVNRVKKMKVQPADEEKIPVLHGAAALLSPNMTDNCYIELPVLQENMEFRGISQTQCLSKLPLNSPLTMPTFLPIGATLIVLDPSTLKIVYANSSQYIPPKEKKISSPMPPSTAKNEPLADASSSCATHTLLKGSQPTAYPNSPVDVVSAMSDITRSDKPNQARSPPGSFNLAQPYSRTPRIVPTEHIRLQAIPAPSIAPSSSTDTANIYKSNPVTNSIPSIREGKMVSLSHYTTSLSAAMHPSGVNEQTNTVVDKSSAAHRSEQKLISQKKSYEPLGAVYEQLKVTALTAPTPLSVPEQPQQPPVRSLEQQQNLRSVDQLGTTKTSLVPVENTKNYSLLIAKSGRINDSQSGLISKNAYGECLSRSPLDSLKKIQPMATGITIASFAKIGDGSEERVRTALSCMPPLEPIVPVKQPLTAASSPYCEDFLNSNKSAAYSPIIPCAELSPVTELNDRHNESLSGITNCYKSSGETEKKNYDRTHPVFQFFKVSCVSGKCECIVDGCGVLRNGKNPASLINHLRLKHPKKEYAEFMAKWTTMWARPKRTTTMIDVTTNIIQPSKILQSTRAKKAKKNSPTENGKGIELVSFSVHTTKAFPVIVPSLISTGLVAPRDSSVGGQISNESLSVGSNIRQAILKEGGNPTTHDSHKKVFFNDNLHPVYRYFTFREAREWPAEVTKDKCGKSECNLQGCNFTMKGNGLVNLMIHLSLKHRDTKEYAEFLSLNKQYEAQRVHKSMDKTSDPNQLGKRSHVQTEVGNTNTYQDFLASRKKQRMYLGTTVLPSSLVKGGQRFSSKMANKVAVRISKQELDFIVPDIPFEYYSSLSTTVHEQPVLNSRFPQRQSQQFSGVSELEKDILQSSN